MSDLPDDFACDSARIAHALERLSHRTREALLLKARHGLSYAEIGAALGLSAAVAEAEVASALVMLRAELERPPSLWRLLRFRRRLLWRPLD